LFDSDFQVSVDFEEAELGGRLEHPCRWYAASIQPGRSAIAALHLSRQGFRAFVPCRESIVRSGRRMVRRVSPFFPGYIFVSFDIERTRWRAVNGTTGIRSLVMQGERPAPVPRGLVEGMIALTGADGLLDLSGGLCAGDRVRLLAGPFADLLGTLDRLGASGRCRVLIEIMNGVVPVIMERKDLASAA
jgi:transcriptional antiterminator RfaH